MKKWIWGSIQVAGLMIFSLAMNQIAQWLQLSIPGSILGIAVVFILLETGIIRLSWIELGANWLLAELLLFFIPAAVGIMNYFPLLQSDGLQILIVVVIGTAAVMAVSGLTAALISKRKERKVS